MHLIITDAWLARSRAIHLNAIQMVLAGLLVSLSLMVVAAGLYHWVFLKGAREGWPVVGSVVKLIAKDEFEQRDRYLRENLDAMARQVSPALMPPATRAPLHTFVGAEENAGFHIQNRVIAKAWPAVHRPHPDIPVANHFTLLDHLANPASALQRAVRAIVLA